MSAIAKPAVSERPILFSAPMVRAILDGRKTQTRRIVDMRDVGYIGGRGNEDDPNLWGWADEYGDWYVIGQDHPHPGQICNGDTRSIVSPYGSPGDRLWVRETWRTMEDPDTCVDGIRFYADSAFVPIENTQQAAEAWVELHRNGKHGSNFRPSIHMPRWASRITLEVTGVRVERLQAITASDACAEGVAELLDPQHPLHSEVYKRFGEYTGDEKLDVDGPYAGAVDAFATLWDSINGKRSPWESNPWVWRVAFKRVRP